jgi:hypothetical protein
MPEPLTLDELRPIAHSREITVRVATILPRQGRDGQPRPLPGAIRPTARARLGLLGLGGAGR